MAMKYHINPELGPLKCSAATPEACRYGVDSPHYDSVEKAMSAWEDQLTEEYGSFSTVVSKKSDVDKAKEDFVKNFNSWSFDELQSFVDASEDNHRIVDEVIVDRMEETRRYKADLDAVNPYKGGDRGCDRETYKLMTREYNDFRDRTAELVEAHTESRFYSSIVIDKDFEKIGTAVKTHSYEPNTTQWLNNRVNSVGGSDVGTLAMNDFLSDKERPFYAKSAMNTIEKTKVNGYSEADIKFNQDTQRERIGAMYRGTVWEARVRDSYANDHPEYTVINTKNQYAHKDRPWQQVNFDGLLCQPGSTVPEGILEIKTASRNDDWADGAIPVGYRAQVLYYLHTTGLKFAEVRVLVNDNEIIDRRIEADEDIVPGSGVTANKYIEERVAPWFKDLQAKRVA